MDVWRRAQDWETDWWAGCTNTYGEEEKQLLYANRMGLKFYHNRKSPYNIVLDGKSVLDIGGGPVSLLLKCDNGGTLGLVEPMRLPKWVLMRYSAAAVTVWRAPGEDLHLEEGIKDAKWDEVWIYNVLQHTRKPKKIIRNARRVSKLIRIFEWVNTPANIGHPHSLTEDKLNSWLGGDGKVENLTGQANCVGACYYGIFPT